MLPWVALGLLLPVGIVMLLQWRQFLVGMDQSVRMERLAINAWAPLLASAGLLGLLWDQQRPMHGQAALAVGTGAMVFAILVGGILLTTDRHDRPWNHFQGSWLVPIAWPVGGILMLLVASAGRVSHVVGLVAFAMGLVLIWLNLMPQRDEEPEPAPSRGDGSLVVTFLAALVLAACARLSPVEWLVPVGVVLSLLSLGVLVLLARHKNVLSAIQAGGWFAVLLPCLGLGLLGQDMLSRIIRADIPGAPPRFEYTSSLLEPGLVLLVTIMVLVCQERWPSFWRAPASLALLVAGLLGYGILMARAVG